MATGGTITLDMIMFSGRPRSLHQQTNDDDDDNDGGVDELNGCDDEAQIRIPNSKANSEG